MSDETAPEVTYLGDLQKLEVGPNDVLVLKLGSYLSRDHVIALHRRFYAVIPGARLIVLEPGMDLGVLSAAAA